MVKIELTRVELEDLIAAVMEARTDCWIKGGVDDYKFRLADLHLKLENALELWIHGGIEQLPIPEAYQKIGCVGWEREHQPHDEGLNG